MKKQDTIQEKTTQEGESIILSDGNLLIYFKDIDETSGILNRLETEDVFFSREFYRAVEDYVPSGTMFRYAFLINGGEIKAFFHFQIKKIDLGESLEAAYDPSDSKSLLEKTSHAAKIFIARKLNYYTLVSGNMLQTGRYGLYLETGFQLEMSLYDEILNTVVKQLKKEGVVVAGVLLKDFYENQRLDNVIAKQKGYHEFSVQPTMLMDIPESWNSIEDYMNSIKSKYKVRARRTFKKCDKVEKVELDLKMLEKWNDRMHDMYNNIATQASFNLFILDKMYFYSLKKHLKEKCKVVGYFLEGKMVGFFSIIYNEQVVDAHFLGYDPAHNKTMHLYHNMLFDLLEEAISRKAKKLDLSRTAMAIKSSIGAAPHKLYLYLKIRNSFLNLFTSPVLKYLIPEIHWEPRNPFK